MAASRLAIQTYFRNIKDPRRCNQQAKLERTDKLAADMDELLMVGKITRDTRQRLQVARENLERQIRRMLLVQ
jgi:hypothetical protein